ncbi:hypothetical protein SAMN03159293_03952 [Pseudomonas sp. NFACC39-1]|nr:hypothetical protein SAMN03159293_03952 [Pseudomonas sp. NFACC39-1]
MTASIRTEDIKHLHETDPKFWLHSGKGDREKETDLFLANIHFNRFGQTFGDCLLIPFEQRDLARPLNHIQARL